MSDGQVPVRRRLASAAWILFVLLVLILAPALPPLAAAEAAMREHRTLLIAVTVSLAALGFAMLMVGAVLLALAGQRKVVTGQEAEEVYERQMSVGHRYATYEARFEGQAAVASGTDTTTFRDMKQAWRYRAWRHDARWRRIFLMAFGALGMLYGGFGIAIVTGPPAVILLCGLALLYATVMLARGFARA